MKITINESMVLMKVLKGRLAELSSLRSECAKKETYFGETQKVVEPQYDIKMLDKRCVEIENALLEMDTRIKQSNAITTIEVDVDKTSLLSSLT